MFVIANELVARMIPHELALIKFFMILEILDMRLIDQYLAGSDGVRSSCINITTDIFY